jgi:hypothetical protein
MDARLELSDGTGGQTNVFFSKKGDASQKDKD